MLMLPHSPEMDSFLQAIHDEPCEDAPRLVFADWLDEHDDPRGEFIRLSCAKEGVDLEDPRRVALSERRSAWEGRWKREWLAGAPGRWSDSRGLWEVWLRGSGSPPTW